MIDESADIKPVPESDAAIAPSGTGPAEPAPKKKRARTSTKAIMAAIEQRLGHKFADISLLTTAFTHVSA